MDFASRGPTEIEIDHPWDFLTSPLAASARPHWPRSTAVVEALVGLCCRLQAPDPGHFLSSKLPEMRINLQLALKVGGSFSSSTNLHTLPFPKKLTQSFQNANLLEHRAGLSGKKLQF